MQRQRTIIRAVIDRVLWTKSATPENRALLAQSIDDELKKHDIPRLAASRKRSIVRSVIDRVLWTAAATVMNRSMLAYAILDGIDAAAHSGQLLTAGAHGQAARARSSKHSTALPQSQGIKA
jgi:hypothetical protein